MKVILDAEAMERALARMAHEILEKNGKEESLMLVGIRTRGVFLAERIQKSIEKIASRTLPLGVLDITLYRDDLSEIGPKASVRETDLPEDLTGKIVVLVDDVLYSGRTVRAALDAIHDLGRPKSIQLAVLIDRGHRELPIKADYVGKNIPTSQLEEVRVKTKETDGADEVLIKEKETK